ncbi:L,D-transpeptidase family protein [Tepidicaulis sp. LMO-SS28]|uniref:L,D-transpeptidase family protein n=1 Tax=Tepidicaulis sp. LMO-SS28 TaxID=3447455 RepID=UPI003EE18A61
MHITVKTGSAPPESAPHRGWLEAGSLRFPCALGRSGMTEEKQEGDGASPIGIWPLREVFYRADRLDAPATDLPISPLHPQDGWCDAPEDPAYNQPVTLPYGASAENLWREDAAYDIIVVLGYNDDPVTPGKGSAIFFHLAREEEDGGYGPTEGCIALSRADMLKVLKLCGPGDTMRIGM